MTRSAGEVAGVDRTCCDFSATGLAAQSEVRGVHSRNNLGETCRVECTANSDGRRKAKSDCDANKASKGRGSRDEDGRQDGKPWYYFSPPFLIPSDGRTPREIGRGDRVPGHNHLSFLFTLRSAAAETSAPYPVLFRSPLIILSPFFPSSKPDSWQCCSERVYVTEEAPAAGPCVPPDDGRTKHTSAHRPDLRPRMLIPVDPGVSTPSTPATGPRARV